MIQSKNILVHEYTRFTIIYLVLLSQIIIKKLKLSFNVTQRKTRTLDHMSTF